MSGVLPSQTLQQLVNVGRIKFTGTGNIVQPNTVDLALSAKCWRLSSLRKPNEGQTVQSIIDSLAVDELDLTRPTILDRHTVYIAELAAELDLPDTVKGRADSRSSTGRTDIQVRLLTDGNKNFDRIAPGYAGKLYAAITPNSFLVRVQAGVRLNQIRLEEGNPYLTDLETRLVHEERGIVLVGDQPVSRKDLRLDNGIVLRLDLQQAIAGYVARQATSHVVDLRHNNNRADLFVQPIAGPLNELTLERGMFYILATLEGIRMPLDYCGILPPLRHEFGEFRSHYAGFIDSGFGWGSEEGTSITLEVRSHENNLTLEHGTAVAPLQLLRTSQPPSSSYGNVTGYESAYQGQRGPKLARYFSEK
jgi:dCTP deaminase